MLSLYLGGSADLLRIDDVLLALPRLLSPLSLLIPFDPASLVAHCLCSARLAFLLVPSSPPFNTANSLSSTPPRSTDPELGERGLSARTCKIRAAWRRGQDVRRRRGERALPKQ